MFPSKGKKSQLNQLSNQTYQIFKKFSKSEGGIESFRVTRSYGSKLFLPYINNSTFASFNTLISTYLLRLFNIRKY